MKRKVFSAMALLCVIALNAQTGHSVYTQTENCTIELTPSQDTYDVDDDYIYKGRKIAIQ